MGQSVDQIAVVRQNEQTLGIVVEAAHRHDAGAAAAHEIRDRLAAALVLECSDVAARLVEHEVALFLAAAERTPVHHNFIAAHIRLVADRGRPSVHGHAAVLDPSLRLAARAKARLRQQLLQSFFHLCKPLFVSLLSEERNSKWRVKS